MLSSAMGRIAAAKAICCGLCRAQLRLTTAESDLSTYTFNKHVIQHHFCAHCGCAPFGLGTAPSGEATAAVNVRCIEGIELTELTRIPYDGRSL